MDYLNEIKKLPNNIKDILISSFSAQVNREIIEEYGLSEEHAGVFIDLVNDIYLKTIKIESLEQEVSKRLNIDPKKAHKLTIDILGKKLLLADDYFAGRVSENLQNLGVNLTDFAAIVAQELNAIEKENAEKEIEEETAKFQDILEDPLEEDEDFKKQSKDDTLDLFKNDLGKILTLGPEFNEVISDYNEDLITFLQDEDFAKELENVLYNNKNVITHIKPIINNTTKAATVENWLKDFISFYGSNNFNTITLAEYLVNSPSAKRLSTEDKRKIKRLLHIYRHIVFFSEIIKNNQGNLEIIPLGLTVKKQEKKQEKVIKEELSNRNEEEKEVETREEKEPSLVEELKIMLKDYPKDSLEHRTILQEIKRLETTKTK